MKKTTKVLLLPLGLILGSNTASASMLEQLIYNVAGQATNAAGARLGDEIYYGSSRSSHSHHKKRVYHAKRKSKKHHTKPQPRMTDEMKIQKALSSLGFYHGPIDGEVNSFETRSAIKAMNKAYGISNSASLKPEVKDSLIYLGTLFKFDRNLIARGTDKRTKGRKIQTALKIQGFYHAKIDGAVGRGTRKCIAEYKAAHGLSSGDLLDFEEEYQLISSAKEINDRNIEETLASLKSFGQQYQTPVPANNTYQQHQSVPQQQQYNQPVQQMVQQSAPPQQMTKTPAKSVETVPVNQLAKQVQSSSVVADNSEEASLEMYTDKK